MINTPPKFSIAQTIGCDLVYARPKKQEGKARIFNISLEGMLFTTDKLFVPEHKLVICFRVAEIPSFPSQGHLTWFSRQRGERKRAIDAE